ncbi:MAG: SDR family oxidoreductase [Myxococcota bacterium]
MRHPKELSRLDGKTVIVTGASDGIGVETARFLADLGATLVLPARNIAKAEAVKADLTKTTGNARIEVMPLDLASLASIRAFTAAFSAKYPKLDVLVDNAGVISPKRVLTVDGFETTFGVNHFGTFALTLGLLGPLRAAAPSRVVVVSSALHTRGRIDFDDLTYAKGYTGGMAMRGPYPDSKLANVLFAYELAERLAGSGVTVNALHPGVVSTNLGRDSGAFFRWMARTFFMTPEKGARTSVYLAASPEVAGVTGKYFDRCAEKASSPSSHDAALRKRLWEVSEKATGTTFA